MAFQEEELLADSDDVKVNGAAEPLDMSPSEQALNDRASGEGSSGMQQQQHLQQDHDYNVPDDVSGDLDDYEHASSPGDDANACAHDSDDTAGGSSRRDDAAVVQTVDVEVDQPHAKRPIANKPPSLPRISAPRHLMRKRPPPDDPHMFGRRLPPHLRGPPPCFPPSSARGPPPYWPDHDRHYSPPHRPPPPPAWQQPGSAPRRQPPPQPPAWPSLPPPRDHRQLSPPPPARPRGPPPPPRFREPTDPYSHRPHYADWGPEPGPPGRTPYRADEEYSSHLPPPPAARNGPPHAPYRFDPGPDPYLDQMPPRRAPPPDRLPPWGPPPDRLPPRAPYRMWEDERVHSHPPSRHLGPPPPYQHMPGGPPYECLPAGRKGAAGRLYGPGPEDFGHHLPPPRAPYLF